MTPECIREIKNIVGEVYVSDAPAARFAYRQDASLFGGTDAAVIVRPGSTEDVSRIMALASRHDVPVVVRGGGSSIYGQPPGVPGKNLLLDMTRMNKILNMDPQGMTVRAEAGIIMSRLQHACNKAGFYLFVPAAPSHTVSFGGWLSGAAGGGGIWWEIISLTVVLPDGTVVRTGGGPGTHTLLTEAYSRIMGGPDFTGLFIGDGGAFGVKTEVTVRLLGLPHVTRASIFVFTDLEKVLGIIREHVARVNPHPFDPILVFGPGANELFSADESASKKFTVLGIMQGHSEPEMNAKRDALSTIAEKLGGERTPEMDALADMMAGGGGGPDSEMEMFGLGFFNSLGLAAWLPFNMPCTRFAEVYPRLIAWREERLAEGARRGFECQARFEFFAPSDQCSITGEVDAFFKDTDSPELRTFAREMICDFQKFTHEMGLLDVYNQGMMSRLNADCWSEGYRALYRALKQAVDPKHILNAGLWLDPPSGPGA